MDRLNVNSGKSLLGPFFEDFFHQLNQALPPRTRQMRLSSLFLGWLRILPLLNCVKRVRWYAGSIGVEAWSDFPSEMKGTVKKYPISLDQDRPCNLTFKRVRGWQRRGRVIPRVNYSLVVNGLPINYYFFLMRISFHDANILFSRINYLMWVICTVGFWTTFLMWFPNAAIWKLPLLTMLLQERWLWGCYRPEIFLHGTEEVLTAFR